MITTTLISDTHGYHNDLSLKGGDILIHAGDVSMRGDADEVHKFFEWFVDQPYAYKCFVAGNHDWWFQHQSTEVIDWYTRMFVKNDVFYLENNGLEIEGLKIWGSPITPEFHSWAFNKERGHEIRQYWQQIPDDTDILITHGPPAGVLDLCRGGNVGCEDLFQRVMEVQPKIHVFGHIHEGYGSQKLGETMCYNASVLDGRYRCVNEPHYLEIEN